MPEVESPATGGFTIEGMNIGELSRLSGLPVKTIRYYSDVGLVPESDRTVANYRRYDHASLVRLEFVRTLRELGLDIATIRRVLDRQADLGQVAAAHAEAIGAQIRILRLRRAALRALSRRAPTPEEVDRMNRIAQATADERRRILAEFWDNVVGDLPDTPEVAQFQDKVRSVTADLPDDPTDEQVDAWIELAEIVRDEEFRARLRAMGQRSFGGRPAVLPSGPEAPRNAHRVTDRVAAAMDADIAPGTPEAAAVVAELVGPWASAVGRVDDDGYRRELLDQLELSYEPRAERYWQLIAIINGWPPMPTQMPYWAWLIEALRATVS
jgi:DNA-binding transcriptional MerR regulator